MQNFNDLTPLFIILVMYSNLSHQETAKARFNFPKMLELWTFNSSTHADEEYYAVQIFYIERYNDS